MVANDQEYTVIILGAGFSKAAGRPLADDLWRLRDPEARKAS